MDPEANEIAVIHNRAESRFEAVRAGHLAVCEYRMEGATMVFTHTFVPPELRGQGVAEQLVRVALELAKKEQRRVELACVYVARFIERHREFQPLLVR